MTDPVETSADVPRAPSADELGRFAGYRAVDQAGSIAGNRAWWDADAERYHAEHGAFLGLSLIHI